MPDYVWDGLRITALRANNEVTILGSTKAITIPEDLKCCVTVEDIAELESPELEELRKVYQPWGMREPWERQNLERFFVLKTFLEKKSVKMPWVVHIDSDVVLQRTMVMGEVLPPGCDVVVSYADPISRMQYDTIDWVVWAGTSVLSLDILQSFVAFALKIYDPQYRPTLEKKHQDKPFLCDMSHWYLFTGASNSSLASSWNWPKDINVPAVEREYSLCDGREVGFDHAGGFKEGGAQQLKSIHFQGFDKDKIKPYYNKTQLRT